MALWMTANQETHRQISDRFDVSLSSVSRCFRRVCRALVDLLPDLVRWPNGRYLYFLFIFLLHKNVCPCVRHLFAIFTFCICSSTNCRDTRWLWGNQWVSKSDWCSWCLAHSHTNPIVTSRCLSQSSQISFHNFTGILFFKFLPTRVSFQHRTFIVIGFPHGGKKYVYIICKLIFYLPCNTCKFLHVRCFQNTFNEGHFDVNTLFNFFLTFS